MKKGHIILLLMALLLTIAAVYYLFVTRSKTTKALANISEDPEILPDPSKPNNPNFPIVGPTTNIDPRFGLSFDQVKICEAIAQNISNAIKGSLGNDDEKAIIAQLNRLNGPKGVVCTSYYYKLIKKTTKNMSWDVISTLTEKEFAQIKETVRQPLMSLAREIGVPKFDRF